MNIHAIENEYNSCDFCKKGWANYRGSAFIKNKTELHRIKTLSNNTFDICNSCSAKMCKTISEDLELLK